MPKPSVGMQAYIDSINYITSQRKKSIAAPAKGFDFGSLAIGGGAVSAPSVDEINKQTETMRLEGEAQAKARAAQEAEVAKQFAESQAAETAPKKDDRNLIQKAIDLISVGSYATANIANNWVNSAEKGKPWYAYIGDVFGGIGSGIEGAVNGGDNARSWSEPISRVSNNFRNSQVDALKRGDTAAAGAYQFWGSTNLDSSDYLAADDAGKTEMLKKSDDKIRENSAFTGLIGDIGLDPLTYGTLGAGAAIKGGAKGLIASSKQGKRIEEAVKTAAANGEDVDVARKIATQQFSAPGLLKQDVKDRLKDASFRAQEMKSATAAGMPVMLRDRISTKFKGTALTREIAQRDALAARIEAKSLGDEGLAVGLNQARTAARNKLEAVIGGAAEELHKFRLNKRTSYGTRKSSVLKAGNEKLAAHATKLSEDVALAVKAGSGGGNWSNDAIRNATAYLKQEATVSGMHLTDRAARNEAVDLLNESYTKALDQNNLKADIDAAVGVAGAPVRGADGSGEPTATPDATAPETATQGVTGGGSERQALTGGHVERIGEGIPMPSAKAPEGALQIEKRKNPDVERVDGAIVVDPKFSSIEKTPTGEQGSLLDGSGNLKADDPEVLSDAHPATVMDDPEFDAKHGQAFGSEMAAKADLTDEIVENIASKPELMDAATEVADLDMQYAKLAVALNDVKVPKTIKASKAEVKAAKGKITRGRYSNSQIDAAVGIIRQTDVTFSSAKKKAAIAKAKAAQSEFELVKATLHDSIRDDMAIQLAWLDWAKKNPIKKMETMFAREQNFLKAHTHVPGVKELINEIVEAGEKVYSTRNIVNTLPSGGTRKVTPEERFAALTRIGIKPEDMELVTKYGADPATYSRWEGIPETTSRIGSIASAIADIPAVGGANHPMFEVFKEAADILQIGDKALTPKDVAKALRAISDKTATPGSATFIAHEMFRNLRSDLNKGVYNGVMQFNTESIARYAVTDVAKARQLGQELHATAVRQLGEIEGGQTLMRQLDEAMARAAANQATKKGRKETFKRGATTEGEGKGAILNEEYNTQAISYVYRELLDTLRGIDATGGRKRFGEIFGESYASFSKKPESAELRRQYLLAGARYIDSFYRKEGIDTVLDNMAPKYGIFEKGTLKSRVRGFENEVTVRLKFSDFIENMPESFIDRFVIGVGTGTDKIRLMPSQIFDIMETMVRSANRLDEGGKLDLMATRMNLRSAFWGTNTSYGSRHVKNPFGGYVYSDNMLRNIMFQVGVGKEAQDAILKMARDSDIGELSFEHVHQALKLLADDGADIITSTKMNIAQKIVLESKKPAGKLDKIFDKNVKVIEDVIEEMVKVGPDGNSALGKMVMANLAETNLMSAHILDQVKKTAIAKSLELKEILENGTQARVIEEILKKKEDIPDLPQDADSLIDAARANQIVSAVGEDFVEYAEKLKAKQNSYYENPGKVGPDFQDIPRDFFEEAYEFIPGGLRDPRVNKNLFPDGKNPEWNRAIETALEAEENTLNAGKLAYDKGFERTMVSATGRGMSARYGRNNTYEAGMVNSHAHNRLVGEFKRAEEKILKDMPDDAYAQEFKNVQDYVRSCSKVEFDPESNFGKVYRLLDSVFEFSSRGRNSYDVFSRLGIDIVNDTPHRRLFYRELANEYGKDAYKYLPKKGDTDKALEAERLHLARAQKELNKLQKEREGLKAKVEASIRKNTKVKLTEDQVAERLAVALPKAETKLLEKINRVDRALGDKYEAIKRKEAIPDEKFGDLWLNWEVTEPSSLMRSYLNILGRTTGKIQMAQNISKLGSRTPKPGYIKIAGDDSNTFANLMDTSRYYHPTVVRELPYWDRILGLKPEIINKQTDIFVNKVFDPVISMLKMFQTTFRPGHHVLSVVGDAWRNFLLTGKPLVPEYQAAMRMVMFDAKRLGGELNGEGMSRALKQIAGTDLENVADSKHMFSVTVGGKQQNLTLAEALNYAERYDIKLPAHAGGTQEDFLTAEGIADKGNDFMSKFQRGMTKVTEASIPVGNGKRFGMPNINAFAAHRDTVMRVALAMHYMKSKNFRSMDDAWAYASAKVKAVSPVSSDLSHFESKYARRAIFYYTWMRGMTPVVLDLMLSKPGMSSIGSKVQYAIAEYNGLDPESFSQPMSQDLQDKMPGYLTERVTGPMFGNSELSASVNFGNPVTDILNTWGAGITLDDIGEDGHKAFQNLVGMASPWLKAVPEIASQTKMDTGVPIESNWQYLTDQISPLRSISKITGKTFDPYINENGAGLIQNRTEARYNGDKAEETKAKAALLESINFLGGLQYTEYGTDSQFASKKFEDRDKASKEKKDQNRTQ